MERSQSSVFFDKNSQAGKCESAFIKRREPLTLKKYNSKEKITIYFVKLPKWFLRSFRHIMPKSWLRLVSCIFCSYLSPCFERRKPPIPSPPHTLPRVTSASTNWGFHHYYPHRTHSLEPRFHFHFNLIGAETLIFWCSGYAKECIN